MHPLKKCPAVFYQHPDGTEPVRDWLRALPPDDRRVLGGDIATIEYGWPVGIPICKPMGGGLWEVRSSLPTRRIARVLFCIQNGKIVLLHAFIKKSQKTPLADMSIAKKRQKEIAS